MRVLVDSSVWIEFFAPKSSLPPGSLEELISQRQVATCQPIKAEVLSGKMDPAARRAVEAAFDAMDFVDLDWNSEKTWRGLVELSLQAQRKRAPIPGIVDRMILACCLGTELILWTRDRKLIKLSKALNLSLFHPELL
jgi:predicted nucleic acid-binding protein